MACSTAQDAGLHSLKTDDRNEGNGPVSPCLAPPALGLARTAWFWPSPPSHRPSRIGFHTLGRPALPYVPPSGGCVAILAHSWRPFSPNERQMRRVNMRL